MHISKKTIIQRHPKIIFKELDGTVYILDDVDDYLFTLNSTVAFVWKKINKPKSFNNLLTEILDNFDVKRAVAESDLRVLLKQLYSKKLIKIKK